MKAYAIKYGDHYLAFGSYRKAWAVSNPLNASLYSQLRFAKGRLQRCYIDGEEVRSKHLKIVEITMSIISEEERND